MVKKLQKKISGKKKARSDPTNAARQRRYITRLKDARQRDVALLEMRIMRLERFLAAALNRIVELNGESEAMMAMVRELDATYDKEPPADEEAAGG